MEILFTHKLLSQIIKNKSERLMEKYRFVQNGYMHIKSNTNIVDMGKILERMETQDHEYENLLRKVDSLERELEMLNKDMDVTIKR